MPLAAKRVFRLSLTIALALAVAYGTAQPLPFIAPLFAFMLGAAPKPPMGPKGLLGLIFVLCIMLGSGLVVLPVLMHYPATGLTLVLMGLFFANYATLNLGKPPIGALLTMGMALISAMGLLGSGVAVLIIQALCINIAIAVLCQWVVYPLFPEQGEPPPAPPPTAPLQSSWLALRATLIVYPAYLLVLTNPSAYVAWLHGDRRCHGYPDVVLAEAGAQSVDVYVVDPALQPLSGRQVLRGVIVSLHTLILAERPDHAVHSDRPGGGRHRVWQGPL